MIDTTNYRKRLEEELVNLTNELNSIGTKDQDAPGGWEATTGPHDETFADPNDVADQLEELGTNKAIETTLEARLMNVKSAIKRIEEGTYGICHSGGTEHEIEPERLTANPAATTCLSHLDEAL